MNTNERRLNEGDLVMSYVCEADKKFNEGSIPDDWFVCRIITFASDIENRTPVVVYKPILHDKAYVVPYESFMAEVDREKNPNVTQKYKFEKITDTKEIERLTKVENGYKAIINQ